jgi:uncharacterized protein
MITGHIKRMEEHMEKDLKIGGKTAVEGFFTWPSEHPQLIASRCTVCGKHYFPRVVRCTNPDCGNPVEDALLSNRGTLWSYTVQHYMPPAPYHPPDDDKEAWTPYGVALVELPEGIRVIGMVTQCETKDLKIGMLMEMIVERQYRDQEGNAMLTWKFRPVVS